MYMGLTNNALNQVLHQKLLTVTAHNSTYVVTNNLPTVDILYDASPQPCGMGAMSLNCICNLSNLIQLSSNDNYILILQST